MPRAALVAYFFGGALLGNAIPHVVSGTTGRAFQSPFAKPPGKGLSSAVVNAGWGAFNIAIAYLLVFRVGTFDLRKSEDAAAFGVGALSTVVLCARLFGPLHGGDMSGSEERG